MSWPSLFGSDRSARCPTPLTAACTTHLADVPSVARGVEKHVQAVVRLPLPALQLFFLFLSLFSLPFFFFLSPFFSAFFSPASRTRHAIQFTSSQCAVSLPTPRGTCSRNWAGYAHHRTHTCRAASGVMEPIAFYEQASAFRTPVIGSIARGTQRLNCSLRGSVEPCIEQSNYRNSERPIACCDNPASPAPRGAPVDTVLCGVHTGCSRTWTCWPETIRTASATRDRV